MKQRRWPRPDRVRNVTYIELCIYTYNIYKIGKCIETEIGTPVDESAQCTAITICVYICYNITIHLVDVYESREQMCIGTPSRIMKRFAKVRTLLI